MEIQKIMSRDIHVVGLNDSVGETAQRMADRDVGFLPVVDGDRLMGIVTDRDIVTRSVALGLAGQSYVRDIMTSPPKSCRPDETVEAVAHRMADQQVRRLPVVDGDDKIVGVISLADLGQQDAATLTATTFAKVVKPAGAHNQRAFHHTAFGN
ncbi:MAG: CBS domain-containing protein [Sphingomonadales bacterium]